MAHSNVDNLMTLLEEISIHLYLNFSSHFIQMKSVMACLIFAQTQVNWILYLSMGPLKNLDVILRKASFKEIFGHSLWKLKAEKMTHRRKASDSQNWSDWDKFLLICIGLKKYFQRCSAWKSSPLIHALRSTDHKNQARLSQFTSTNGPGKDSERIWTSNGAAESSVYQKNSGKS